MVVPRDWLAGVKRAEVETALALPGSGSSDHAMSIVEVVTSRSKAGHECSRSVDASRAALRRPEDREQMEFFWSQAPPFPSGAFGGRARRVTGRGCPGGLETCGSSGASCATGGLDG